MSEAIDDVQPRRDPGGQDVDATEISPRDLGVAPQAWRSVYVHKLAITDLVVLVVAIGVANIWRFGAELAVQSNRYFSTSYLIVGVAIVVLWWVALALTQSRDKKLIAEGPDEYRRVVRASILVFGWIAIISLMFKFDVSRGYLAIAFPLGTLGLLVGRKYWRRRLLSARRRGMAISSVLVIGGVRSAKRITRTLNESAYSGYRVTGVWVPDRDGTINEWLDVPGHFIPVLGTNRTLAGALTIADADTVIVTDTEHLGHDGLRALTWQLEGVDVDLLVSPNVIDVAGPRVHVRAVANMPLIHLEEPKYGDATRIGKVAFDKVVATVALIVLSPIMLVAAIAVKATSKGPVLYHSERIGVGGEPFNMLKFRSMVSDADTQVASLTGQSTGAGPLFKMKDDPRVTRVGAFLRRYSIDELPQIFNVLKGEMSIVGPRPPLGHEVAQYEDETHRRLLVRQGITGLWQVSGRSDLSWEESVRLDLDYVENWSMTRDLQIIWRTVKAVVKSRGAY